METNKRVIEVNGVKLEVDLSQCRVVENYKVGQGVKVLVKEYSSYKSHVGTIIGFDNFQSRPTIVIAYMDLDYSSAEIKFVYYNSETKEVEICPLLEYDLPASKAQVIDRLEKHISKCELELQEAKRKKEIFLLKFGEMFENKEA